MLFQISAVVGVAIKNDAIAVFPEWKYGKYFKSKLNTSPYINPTHHYHEQGFNYKLVHLDASLQELVGAENEIYNLHGYYQSSKYWDHCESEIKKTLQFKDVLLRKPTYSHAETCAVHVRRGDYVGNDYYAQLGMDYYASAIACIKDNSLTNKFLIFSDDIEWCKKHFLGDEFYFSEGKSDIEDLAYMSSCDHLIMANSSFSYWAGVLNFSNSKVVVAPKKDNWFGTKANLNVNDLYLDKWILI